MRRRLVLVAMLGLFACAGEPGTSPSASPSPSTPRVPQTSFPVDGCPIDDAEACAVIARSAIALVAGDAADLMAVSRPDRFDCAGLPVDVFPGCADGEVLRGHPIASSEPTIEVLPRPNYRSRLDAILDGVEPEFSDTYGGGATEVLGVGTCGPEDIERRSYHLGMTMGVSEDGASAERLLGSFEFVNREGRWWIGIWYLDRLDAWEQTSPDPFATIACGNMEPWAAASEGTAETEILQFVGDGAPLDPGRYTNDEFEPYVSFEIGQGWVGGHSHDEFFDVQREEGVLLGFGRPGFVVGAEGDVDVDGLGAEDALRTIASIDGLDADPVTPTSIDGRRAFELRFRTDESVPLFGGDDGTFSIQPGAQRLLAVEVDGTLVLVVDDVWARPRERVDALVQGVIDSIRFDPGA